MSKRTLICCAHPLGYGPAAKLLHIAHHLRGADIRLVFLGNGIAHELAARSKVFAEVIEATPNEDRARLAIQAAAGLLSLMDREFAALAVQMDRPIFVADSLLWMRDQVPDVFRQARRFWAQDFLGVRDRLGEIGSNATLVGPIVAPATQKLQTERTRFVINLGGGEAPHGGITDQPAYLDFVLAGLFDSGIAQNADAVLLGGAKCIRHLQMHGGEIGLEMISASHATALDLLRSARLVLTAPGLTATLECFQLGVPTFFLPPENYSQWWILAKLRERGLAPCAFHWRDLFPDDPIQERMAEQVRGPLVREAIQRGAGEPSARRQFADRLNAIAATEKDELAQRQRAFFDSLGPDGARQIANDLERLL